MPYEPDWAPSVADVGAVLRSRTKDSNGNILGTFNDDTQPTEEQVQPLIDTAVSDVAGDAGPVPDILQDAARRVAAIGAALLVELTFFPHDTGRGSPYTQLKEWYDDKFKRLLEQVSEANDTGGEVGQSEVLSPAYAFPLPVTGWGTRW